MFLETFLKTLSFASNYYLIKDDIDIKTKREESSSDQDGDVEDEGIDNSVEGTDESNERDYGEDLETTTQEQLTEELPFEEDSLELSKEDLEDDNFKDTDEDEITTEDEFLDLMNDAMATSNQDKSNSKEKFRSNKESSEDAAEMSYQEAYEYK